MSQFSRHGPVGLLYPVKSLFRRLRRPYEYLILTAGFALLGVGCLLWTLFALPLKLLLSRLRGVWLGRNAATLGFRAYLFVLQRLGAARFDLRELDALREAGPLIIVANHPGLLDAPMVLSRLPNIVCVMKGSLIKNPLWGAGARLAGYIRNDWFIGSVNLAIMELHNGSQLLLFPEGTRTGRAPLGNFHMGPAYISYRSGVPIQTIFIEQDNDFLGKHQSLFKRPDMPMHFRIRLGLRYDSPADPRAFTKVLHDYFSTELGTTFSS
jgi:1-acyl-sn-glycerol-3-phosphate acyltransferase